MLRRLVRGVRSRLWVLAILLSPVAVADHPLTVVLSDWSSGSWLVGTPVAVPGPAADLVETRIPIDVPECHRVVLLDLAFSPNSTAVEAQDVGTVTVFHEVRASLWNGTQEIASARIFREGFDHRVGAAPAAGAYEVHLRLVTGADVDWSARVRGLLVQSDEACTHVVG